MWHVWLSPEGCCLFLFFLLLLLQSLFSFFNLWHYWAGIEGRNCSYYKRVTCPCLATKLLKTYHDWLRQFFFFSGRLPWNGVSLVSYLSHTHCIHIRLHDALFHHVYSLSQTLSSSALILTLTHSLSVLYLRYKYSLQVLLLDHMILCMSSDIKRSY